jgi:PAT family beta-lactamase induction signal transducer AmpG
MYKTWGLMNIGIYTSLLYLPDKTIMESIYRLVRHQEKMVLAMQLVISIAFLLVGLTIPMNNFFVISLAIFWVAALHQLQMMLPVTASIC